MVKKFQTALVGWLVGFESRNTQYLIFLDPLHIDKSPSVCPPFVRSFVRNMFLSRIRDKKEQNSLEQVQADLPCGTYDVIRAFLADFCDSKKTPDRRTDGRTIL